MAVTFYFARHGETQFNIIGKVQGWSDSPLSARGIYSAYKLGTGLADVEFVGACASDSQRAQDTLSIALEARENERARLREERLALSFRRLMELQSSLPDLSDFAHLDEVAAMEEFLRSRGCLDPRSTELSPAQDHPEIAPWLVTTKQWLPSTDRLDRFGYPAQRLASHAGEGRNEKPVPLRIDTRLREWCFGDLEGQPMVKLRNRLYDLFGEDLPRGQQNKRIDEIANYLHDTDKTHRAEDFATISTRAASFLDDCGAAVQRNGGGNVLVVTHAMLIRALVFMFADRTIEDPSRIENASVTKLVWDGGAVTVEAVSDTSHLRFGADRSDRAKLAEEGDGSSRALREGQPADEAPSAAEA